MNLTNPEKLILTMLCDLLDHTQAPTEIDTKLIRESIVSNNTWSLTWELPGIVGDNPEPTPPEVNEVVDILEIYSLMQIAYDQLDPVDQERIKEEVQLHTETIQFPGFDGNNEGRQMSIARHLIEEMNRFTEFGGKYLNSHSRMLPKYRQMLPVAKEIQRTKGGFEQPYFSAQEIIDILNA